MKRTVMIAGLVLAGILLSGQSHASYLETRPTGGPTERRIMPPPPPPPRGNEITRLVSRITVGRPYTTRNLRVFPLYVGGATDRTRYVTLDDALNHGWLKVYERGAGRVQQVIVRNDSRHYVFLMAGEIISGAKQNRVIATDTLLRPHGPEVAVPVYCVERGRWVGKTMAFSSEKSFANNALRYKAQSKAGQNAVWVEVSRVSKEVRVKSRTSDFQAVVNDKEVQKALGEYAGCMPRPPRRCIGAVIVINNAIAGVELFANEALFAALWPKVRRGYALDAYPIYEDWLGYKRRARFVPIGERDIRAFLNRVHHARFTARNGVDLGRLCAIRGNAIGGEGLVFETSVIHVNFAPERYVIMPVRPRPPVEF